jgi:hypothetical protein
MMDRKSIFDSTGAFAHHIGRTQRIFGVMITVLVIGLAGSARATPNIVVNGGFEARNFSGWTQFGDPLSRFSGVQCPGPGFTVQEGNCSAFFGPVGATAGISQILNLQSGQHYLLTFAFEPDGQTPSSFLATLGGVTLLSLANPAASAYRTFSFAPTGTAAAETLAFTFRDDAGFLFLDAVSLTTAPVPEPSSLELVGISLLALCVALRRRAK